MTLAVWCTYVRVELEVCAVLYVCVHCPCSEHVMLEHCVSHTPSFCAAEQVLNQLRGRLITDVNANCIVFELKHKNIIPDGLLAEITRNVDPSQQNQLLYRHLEMACTVEALMTVCDIMISVPGYPKMNQLGEDMKSMLQGKYREGLFIHGCSDLA